jgi:hypothetical protein
LARIKELDALNTGVAGELPSRGVTVAKHPVRRIPRVPLPKSPRGRSAVSNGSKLLMSNGSTKWGRRFIDLVAEHCDELGSVELLTAAQIGLIRRVSALECELELREDKLAAGEAVDLDEFARVSGHCRRIWETLGFRRVKKDTVPRLHSYIKKQTAKEIEQAEAAT